MAVERYHGSAGRTLVYRSSRPFVRLARKAIWFAVRPFQRVPAEVLALLRQSRRRADAGDWDGARASARAAATIVEASGHNHSRRLAGGKLLRLGDCGRALRLLAETLPPRLSAAKEWRGESLAGRRLFVRQLHMSNMGAPIRMARFLSRVVGEAERTVVLVEGRLVPIFHRTFPAAEVRALAGKAIADATPDDFVTSFEGLTAACVTDWPSVGAFPFTPLKADSVVTAELRRKYLAGGGRPLVGLTWGSKNGNKETPELSAWADLVRSLPAAFVSLQYGQVSAALEKLREGGGVLIDDPSVDQLVDMDRLAAQIAALDAVVAISNTAAHLAGAMGKPTILVSDDAFRGAYPAVGAESFWYPSMTIPRKAARSWDSVMEEAGLLLQGILAPR